MSLRAVAVACLVGVCASISMYDPPEAGPALDAVEKAMANIVQNPHLPPSVMAIAKKAVANVDETVHFLESAKGKALSKEARGAKVMASIKELEDLQAAWQKAAATTVFDRKAELMKKLQEKEAELAKDKKMMKVLNLEKALAEKKLKLEKLIEAKQAQEANKEDAKAVAAREEMVANVLKLAKDKKVGESDPKLLAQVSTYMEGRMKTLSSNMANIDAALKKREAEIKATLGDAASSKANAAEMKKQKDILNMLVKKEARQYKKMRAGLQNEYNELANAMKSIKDKDAAGLSKVATHMQSEMKSLEAKSHKFLY